MSIHQTERLPRVSIHFVASDQVLRIPVVLKSNTHVVQDESVLGIGHVLSDLAFYVSNKSVMPHMTSN